MKHLLLWTFIFLASFYAPLAAQTRVPVTIRVTPNQIQESGTTIIPGTDLKKDPHLCLFDQLESTPSIFFTENGRSTFLRGRASEGTLLAIDGFPVSDAASIGGGIDLSQVVFQELQEIELITGPSRLTAPIGSASGTINLLTAKPKPGLSLGAMGGSFETIRTWGGMQETTQSSRYSLMTDMFHSGNISAAGSGYGNFETDPLRSLNVLGTLDRSFSDHLETSWTGFYGMRSEALDNFGGANGDDLNASAFSQLGLLADRTRVRFSRALTQEVLLGMSLSDRQFNNPLESGVPADRSRFTGITVLGESTATIQINPNLSGDLSMGMKSEFAQTSELGCAAHEAFLAMLNSLSFSHFMVRTGLKGVVATYGPNWAVSVESGMELPRIGTRLLASFGRGYRLPTLYQRYSRYGSSSIQPEGVLSWEAGIEQPVTKWMTIRSTYFEDWTRNLIEFDSSTSRYQNHFSIFVQGLETTAQFAFEPYFRLSTGYSRLNAENLESKRRMRKRPEHSGFFKAHFRPHRLVSLSWSTRFVGARSDMTPTGDNVGLAAYWLSSVGASAELGKGFRLITRIENLLDSDYEESYGYGTRGRGYYLGLSWN